MDFKIRPEDVPEGAEDATAKYQTSDKNERN